jgi:hypothetical protein
MDWGTKIKPTVNQTTKKNYQNWHSNATFFFFSTKTREHFILIKTKCSSRAKQQKYDVLKSSKETEHVA